MGGPAVKIQVKVNGTAHTSEVEPRLLLVHYLRDVLDLTGTHVGCDTSQCGACTILVNGRPSRRAPVRGPGRRRRDHDDRGAGQGRAAPPDPGRLLGEARAPVRLLHAGHDHDGRRAPRSGTRTRPRTEIRHGLEGNLCRCTGYHNIVKAIQYAAEKMRLGTGRARPWHRPSSSAPASSGARTPGSSPARAVYTDDVKLPGQTYAAFVRSPHAHARVRRVDLSPAKRVPGVVAAYTGQDMAEGGVGPLPCGWLLPDIKIPEFRGVATDKVTSWATRSRSSSARRPTPPGTAPSRSSSTTTCCPR